RREKHRVELTVCGLVPAHPADGRPFTRVRRLVLDPQPPLVVRSRAFAVGRVVDTTGPRRFARRGGARVRARRCHGLRSARAVSAHGTLTVARLLGDRAVRVEFRVCRSVTYTRARKYQIDEVEVKARPWPTDCAGG